MMTEAEKRKQREDDERRRRNNQQQQPLLADNNWTVPVDTGYSIPCSDSGSCGGCD